MPTYCLSSMELASSCNLFRESTHTRRLAWPTFEQSVAALVMAWEMEVPVEVASMIHPYRNELFWRSTPYNDSPPMGAVVGTSAARPAGRRRAGVAES